VSASVTLDRWFPSFATLDREHRSRRRYTGVFAVLLTFSHLQAHRVDQDEQDARNVDEDAEKCSDNIERVQSRGVQEGGEINQTKAPATPVWQGHSLFWGISLKLRRIDECVNRCGQCQRDYQNADPLLRRELGWRRDWSSGDNCKTNNLCVCRVDRGVRYSNQRKHRWELGRRQVTAETVKCDAASLLFEHAQKVRGVQGRSITAQDPLVPLARLKQAQDTPNKKARPF